MKVTVTEDVTVVNVNSEEVYFKVLVKEGEDVMAEKFALQAKASAEAAKLDAQATAEDRIQTGLDATTSTTQAGIATAAAQSIESSILALGSISGTVDINLALGTLITATLTGATTLTFSGLPPSTRETAFTLRFAGIHAITLPAGTKYPAGSVPVPAGALYEIPCTINNAGELIVYGVINDIKTP
jgi:hypothetical protein